MDIDEFFREQDEVMNFRGELDFSDWQDVVPHGYRESVTTLASSFASVNTAPAVPSLDDGDAPANLGDAIQSDHMDLSGYEPEPPASSNPPPSSPGHDFFVGSSGPSHMSSPGKSRTGRLDSVPRDIPLQTLPSRANKRPAAEALSAPILPSPSSSQDATHDTIEETSFSTIDPRPSKKARLEGAHVLSSSPIEDASAFEPEVAKGKDFPLHADSDPSASEHVGLRLLRSIKMSLDEANSRPDNSIEPITSFSLDAQQDSADSAKKTRREILDAIGSSSSRKTATTGGSKGQKREQSSAAASTKKVKPQKRKADQSIFGTGKETPGQYAQLLLEHADFQGYPDEAPTLDSEIPKRYPVLKGLTVYYCDGDKDRSSYGTRHKMELIIMHGGKLQPVFDAATCTHIAGDASEGVALARLGYKSWASHPKDIPIVGWDFFSKSFATASMFVPEKKKKGWTHWADVPICGYLGEEWDYPAYSHCMPAYECGLSSRLKGNRRLPDNARSIWKKGKKYEANGYIVDSGDEDDVVNASTATAQESTSASDPLAEFYDAAREDASNQWARQGEYDDTDSTENEKDESDREDTPVKVTMARRKYTCDQIPEPESHPAGDCPNQDVVDKLQELQGLHRVKTAQDDHWRTYSYSRSIPHIRAYKTRIKSYAEARKIPRVGHRTAMKIMEIINSGELQRIKFERTPDVQAMKLFEGIYGVGPTTGLRWYMNGLRTLDDVRNEKNGIKLTPAQRIGVEFYDDINERMPREEVQALFDLIKPRVLNIDPRLVVQVMGSFRRGKADCGDIDILITRPTDDGKTHRGVLQRLIADLHECGIITEDLAMPDDGDGDEGIYRGLCRLPKEGSKRRRIDFLVVPWESRGAALIYYTGDDIFNRAMRFKAGNMGYSLNQHGLFAGVVRDPRNRQNKLNEGNVIASATEEEIFRILGVPWQEPHQRVRSNIS